MNRNKNLLELRPQLALPVSDAQSYVEAFQNETLRPILKFQHDLFIYRFANDAFTVKSGVLRKDNKWMQNYIDERLKSDKKLQKELIGMVTGLFTIEEYSAYWEAKSELNRRILSMLAKRIYDGLRSSEPLEF